MLRGNRSAVQAFRRRSNAQRLDSRIVIACRNPEEGFAERESAETAQGGFEPPAGGYYLLNLLPEAPILRLVWFGCC